MNIFVRTNKDLIPTRFLPMGALVAQGKLRTVREESRNELRTISEGGGSGEGKEKALRHRPKSSRDSYIARKRLVWERKSMRKIRWWLNRVHCKGAGNFDLNFGSNFRFPKPH